MKKIVVLVIIIFLFGCSSDLICNDYDCVYDTLSQGKSAKIILTEFIESLGITEKSEILIEPLPEEYLLTMKLVDISKNQQKTKSIAEGVAKTCPQIIDNLDRIKGKLAVCHIDKDLSEPINEVISLAKEGLSSSNIKRYECEGELIEVIKDICNTPNYLGFPPGVKKPAIYLYPKQEQEIMIELDIRGIITKSDPEYEEQWKVVATTDSIIDDKYDYLFYEAQLDVLLLPDNGWVVEGEELSSWFNEYLPRLGLEGKEIVQFKEYWLPELPHSDYYVIKKLGDDFLKQNMRLIITPNPDTLIRVLLYFEPVDSLQKMPEPNIQPQTRHGFTVVEWGGLMSSS